jgi:galactose mutarotase-like enzyme
MKADVELGIRRLTLENEIIRLQMLPDVGSKITSLLYKPGNHEFLFQPPNPAKAYSVPGYGSLFKDFDNSGFDECLPTVGACRYPAKASDICLPDHGEVWSVPWEWQALGNNLELRCRGTQVPFAFQKNISLEGNRLTISYKLENLSDDEMPYLWSSHPLFIVRPGDRIMIPAEVTEVFIDQSHTGRWGRFGDRCHWPVTTDKSGKTSYLNVLQPPSENTAEKYFTPRLSEGWCALYSPSAGHSIAFHFDPAAVPFIGMWINQGGWPVNSAAKHYTVALEPCSGAPDSLERAVEFNQANVLGGKETRGWELEIDLQPGPPTI